VVFAAVHTLGSVVRGLTFHRQLYDSLLIQDHHCDVCIRTKHTVQLAAISLKSASRHWDLRPSRRVISVFI